jgi:hypothetical protein
LTQTGRRPNDKEGTENDQDYRAETIAVRAQVGRTLRRYVLVLGSEPVRLRHSAGAASPSTQVLTEPLMSRRKTFEELEAEDRAQHDAERERSDAIDFAVEEIFWKVPEHLNTDDNRALVRAVVEYLKF